MLLLHPNLAHLCKLAGDNTRFSLGAVRLQAAPTGYQAAATDGKVLGIVTASNAADPAEYPTFPALEQAPNGATEALVPAGELARACKDAPRRAFKPVLKSIACILADKVTTLGTTDLDSCLARQPRNVEGRFPDVDAARPAGAPAVSLEINPELLVQLLQVAAGFSELGARVTLEVRANAPLVVKARNSDQEFYGLCMPLS